MSGMSFLERLLDGAAVEWKLLGGVCDVYTGGEAPANCIKGSTPDNIFKYPIYGNGAEIYGYTDSYKIGKDAVTISSIGANTGTVYFREACFTPIIRLKVLIPKYDELLPRYLYHYLSSQTISSKKSSVPNMNAADVKKLQIPIPCPDNPDRSLAIQAEIVRILDTFTELTRELTTELTRELTLRKKQYEYYRDRLLTFEEGEVEWKTLGDENFFEVGSGGTPSKTKPEYWNDGNIPWLKSESCNNVVVYSANHFITELGLKKSSAKLLAEKTSLIALVGATIFKTAFLEFSAALLH